VGEEEKKKKGKRGETGFALCHLFSGGNTREKGKGGKRDGGDQPGFSEEEGGKKPGRNSESFLTSPFCLNDERRRGKKRRKAPRRPSSRVFRERKEKKKGKRSRQPSNYPSL